jgi:hypothetical protein
MPRRRRTRNEWDAAEAVYTLVLLAMLLAFVFLSVRQAILSLGVVLLGLVGLTALVGAGFVIYRVIDSRRRRADQHVSVKAFDLNTIHPVVTVSPPPQQPSRYAPSEDTSRYAPKPPPPNSTPQSPKSEPLKTADLVARLHAIDWYQFEKIVAITVVSTLESGVGHRDAGSGAVCAFSHRAQCVFHNS